MTNLASFLAQSARAQGNRIAVRQGETALTYAALDDASARMAALLARHGVKPGDRVALALPNVPAFPVAYYGALRAGAAVVPMNPLLKAAEMEFVLADAAVHIVVTCAPSTDEALQAADRTGAGCLVTGTPAFEAALGAAEPARDIADRPEDATAVILYTSGTTGTPKGAELTHRNLMTNTMTCVETLFHLGPHDVLFGGLPLFHAFGQTCALNAAVAAGASLTLLPRFDPRAALELVARDGVTVFLGVPTMYTALLQAGIPADCDVSRLRVAVSGGSALPVEVLHSFEREFGAVVLEGYGLSETSPVATFNPPDRPRRPGSIGMPVRGVQVRLVAEDGSDVAPGGVGEIAIRGENVMKGYWNQPAATAEACRGGWFHTGDLARVDEDGYYFIVDRKKDLIIRGGFNVYPREVEEVLYQHPDVVEAAVVGVAHAVHGEEVAAVIVLRAHAQTSAEGIRAFVKERVAPYKYPRIVTLADQLPKGPTGKILKREIVVDQPAASVPERT
jgi:long-chain acyl-CoA synthetase